MGYLKGQYWDHCYFLVFVNTIDNGIASEVLKFADDIKVFLGPLKEIVTEIISNLIWIG